MELANDLSNEKYDIGYKIIYKKEILKSNLCDYNDDYILVRGNITIIGYQVTKIAFRNCAPFTKCTTKIDGAKIDDVEDLDVVMPMYNLIESSSNYSETTGSLWFYSKDEGINFNSDIANNNNNFKSFEYKAKLLGYIEANNANEILKNVTIAVPLKYLSNCWRSLERPLINCKVELKLRWTKYCVLSAAGADNPNDKSNNNIFTIKDTKWYVPAVRDN